MESHDEGNMDKGGNGTEIIDVGVSLSKGVESLIEDLDKNINNGSGKMKVKCVKCGTLEELRDDDVKLLAYVVKRYNQEPSPEDYLSVWSTLRGNCTDNEKHEFIFDKYFDKEIADTIKEYNDAIVNNNEKKIAFEKVCHQIEETNKILKDLDKNKTYVLAEMNAGEILIQNIRQKFIKLTGMEDMTIWS